MSQGVDPKTSSNNRPQQSIISVSPQQEHFHHRHHHYHQQNHNDQSTQQSCCLAEFCIYTGVLGTRDKHYENSRRSLHEFHFEHSEKH